MPTRTVLFDTYCWMTPLAGQPGRYQHNTAERGTDIEVSSEEAARGEGLGALGTRDQFEAQEAVKTSGVMGGAAAFTPQPDEAIEAMTVAQVHAYLNSVPSEQRDDEVRRVVELEELRDKPRSSVLELGE